MTSVEPDNCVIYPSMLKSSFFLFSKHVFSAQLNNNNNIASRDMMILISTGSYISYVPEELKSLK